MGVCNKLWEKNSKKPNNQLVLRKKQGFRPWILIIQPGTKVKELNQELVKVHLPTSPLQSRQYQSLLNTHHLSKHSSSSKSTDAEAAAMDWSSAEAAQAKMAFTKKTVEISRNKIGASQARSTKGFITSRFGSFRSSGFRRSCSYGVQCARSVQCVRSAVPPQVVK